MWGGGVEYFHLFPLIQTKNGHSHHGQQVKKSHPISRSQNPPTSKRSAGHSGNHAGVVSVSSNSITGIGTCGCEHCRVCTCTVLCNPALKYVHQIYEVNWPPNIRKEQLCTDMTEIILVFSS